LYDIFQNSIGIVWLKSQVERSRSVLVLLLFGYKVTRTEWLQLGNILLRSGTIPLQKNKGSQPLCSHPALLTSLSLCWERLRYLSRHLSLCWPLPPPPSAGSRASLCWLALPLGGQLWPEQPWSPPFLAQAPPSAQPWPEQLAAPLPLAAPNACPIFFTIFVSIFGWV
jgi:hypothetical protein